MDFFGNDEDAMVQVAIARSTNYTTGNDDNGGGKPKARSTNNITGNDDNGGGNQGQRRQLIP
jgi:hypothetical protein